MTTKSRILATALAAILTASPLAAQQPDRGSPLWGGLSAGSARMSNCHGEYVTSCNYTEGRRAPTLQGSFGTRYDHRTLVGLEVGRWGVKRGETEVSTWSAGPVVHLYPNPARGLNLKLSAGVTSIELDGREDDMIFAEQHRGAFALVGVGYDLPLTPLVTLRAGVDHRYSTYLGDAFRSVSNLWEATAGLRLNWPSTGGR